MHSSAQFKSSDQENHRGEMLQYVLTSVPDTGGREYALSFSDQPHPGANMFRQLVQRIRWTGRFNTYCVYMSPTNSTNTI
jgi:hypothetical protein